MRSRTGDAPAAVPWRRPAGGSRVGPLLVLLLVAATIYFGVGAVEEYWRYVQFRDEMGQQALVAPSVPDAVIRRRLVAKAEELGLPAEAKVIEIVRKPGDRITIRASYEVPIQLPGTTKMWRFEARAEARL